MPRSKLSVVATDIFGVSGRAMMAAMVRRGTQTLRCWRSWRGPGCGPRSTALEEAFTGHFTDHHAFLLGKMLARVDGIDADIADLGYRDREADRPRSRRRWSGWMRPRDRPCRGGCHHRRVG